MTRISNMVRLVEEYVSFRRAQGFALRTEGDLLLNFGRFADSVGHAGPITVDLAVQWARLPEKAQPIYWARRLEIVTCFAKYRRLFDASTEVPSTGLLGPAHRRTTPHVYSRSEVETIIRAAANLSPEGGLRPRTYAAFLGLLAATGLRVGEALRLTSEHVDLSRGMLTITETKFHKSRFVPLHRSAVEALCEYAAYRDSCFRPGPCLPFFLSQSGKQLPYTTVRTVFQGLCRSTGMPRNAAGRLPRLYDLRHTYACRVLMRWHDQGEDVNSLLPVLSTYMGHVKLADTYWYVTGIPELLGLAAGRFERYAAGEGGLPS